MRKAPSGSARCSFSASGVGAVIQVRLFGRRQDDRHGLGMDRRDLGVRPCRQEAEDADCLFAGSDFALQRR